jgi:hypothetical protein
VDCRLIAILGVCAATFAFANGGAGITDAASAVEAARKYVKARCPPEKPCKFKPEREGKQWRVWVKLPPPAGSLVLYFDTEGNLLRRLEAD